MIRRFIDTYAILSMSFHRDIRQGQKYIHRDLVVNRKDPFKPKDTSGIVEVLAVKNKWINFRFDRSNSMFQDERLPRTAFNFTYKRVR